MVVCRIQVVAEEVEKEKVESGVVPAGKDIEVGYLA